MNIPAKIVERLRAAGWTDHAIADRVGVTVKTIRRWAKGETRPISEFFHQRLDDLEKAA